MPDNPVEILKEMACRCPINTPDGKCLRCRCLAAVEEMENGVVFHKTTADARQEMLNTISEALGFSVFSFTYVLGQIDALQRDSARLATERQARETAEKRLAAVVGAIRWISVSEALPLHHGPVLVHGGVAAYRDGVWFTGMETPMYSRPIMWNVTHWAELPVPPALALAGGKEVG